MVEGFPFEATFLSRKPLYPPPFAAVGPMGISYLLTNFFVSKMKHFLTYPVLQE
jgi:hypothetical protein